MKRWKRLFSRLALPVIVFSFIYALCYMFVTPGFEMLFGAIMAFMFLYALSLGF